MPPEMILGKGYDITADYWQLGVLTFAFLTASYPFGSDESNPMDIY